MSLFWTQSTAPTIQYRAGKLNSRSSQNLPLFLKSVWVQILIQGDVNRWASSAFLKLSKLLFPSLAPWSSSSQGKSHSITSLLQIFPKPVYDKVRTNSSLSSTGPACSALLSSGLTHLLSYSVLQTQTSFSIRVFHNGNSFLRLQSSFLSGFYSKQNDKELPERILLHPFHLKAQALLCCFNFLCHTSMCVLIIIHTQRDDFLQTEVLFCSLL